MLMRLAIAVLISLVATPAMADGRYSADRYDSRIEVLDGGTMRVTETIALRFETGTFTQFFRAIPVRMTDGIEIVSASMDGRSMAEGKGPGQFERSGSSTVRVTWRFAPTPPSTHTFDLVYLVHGVVRREENADVLAWRILPTEHRYHIASSTADIYLPAQPARSPMREARRVGEWSLEVNDRHIRITANDIRGNGWLETSVDLPH